LWNPNQCPILPCNRADEFAIIGIDVDACAVGWRAVKKDGMVQSPNLSMPKAQHHTMPRLRLSSLSEKRIDSTMLRGGKCINYSKEKMIVFHQQYI